MVAQAVNFLIVFIVLYIFALKPLSKLMAERKEKIEKGMDDAKANAALLDKTRDEYEEVLRKAKIEANTLFQEGKKSAEAKKTIMLEEAKLEVEKIIENGKKSLNTEKTKVIEDTKKEIAVLAMLAAEKILRDKQDINDL